MARPVRVFLALLLVASAASAEPLTTDEREKLLAHLETTRHAFLASVDGLTDAQWSYRPAEGRWTIAEVAEHIAATEQMLRGMVEGIVPTRLRENDKEYDIRVRLAPEYRNDSNAILRTPLYSPTGAAVRTGDAAGDLRSRIEGDLDELHLLAEDLVVDLVRAGSGPSRHRRRRQGCAAERRGELSS